jgi:hypothetical protein
LNTRRGWFVLALTLSACVLYETEDDEKTLPPECGDEHSSPDGGPCTCSADCISESATCFDEYTTGSPQGFCARKCSRSADCDQGYTCEHGYCSQTCQTGDDCGAGRSCQTTEIVGVASHRYCAPLCDDDSDCRSNDCGEYSNRCLRKGDEPQSGGGVGAVCERNADCRSNMCLDGACFTLCDTSSGACPDDAFCAEGLCLPRCETDADCADYGVKSCNSLDAESCCV